MRKLMRTMCAGMFVAMMLQRSAAACCGWDDGYFAPMYYGPVVYGGGCYDCGYETVAYDCCECGPCGECGAVATEGAPVETLQSPPVQATAPVTAPTNSQLPPSQTPPAAAEITPPPQLPAPPQSSATAPANAEPGLFGTEAAPPMPPAATPPKSAESTSDLFGPPAEKPATSTPPTDTAPGAATPPAGAGPAGGATPPAASSTDDIFGAPPKSETNAGAATTTQKPANETSAPPTPPAATPPAGNEDKKDDKKAEKDLFGASPSILREAGGLASDEMRLWTDNTGSFSCRGRLVRVLDGHARLLKDNGHTTTVPLGRLNARDLEFVNRQARAQHSELVKTAQTTVHMPTSAN